jgi:XrtJ-associated TM-motif-TM protein
MSSKRMLFVFGLVLVFVAARPLRAQSGCVDSPEDPTVVLALLASGGLVAANARRIFGRKR